MIIDTEKLTQQLAAIKPNQVKYLSISGMVDRFAMPPFEVRASLDWVDLGKFKTVEDALLALESSDLKSEQIKRTQERIAALQSELAKLEGK